MSPVWNCFVYDLSGEILDDSRWRYNFDLIVVALFSFDDVLAIDLCDDIFDDTLPGMI